jgi:hypothetical protein
LRLSHLPRQPAFAYTVTKHELADEAVLFSLRGVGVSDDAIREHFQPSKLQAMLDLLFPNESD